VGFFQQGKRELNREKSFGKGEGKAMYHNYLRSDIREQDHETTSYGERGNGLIQKERDRNKSLGEGGHGRKKKFLYQSRGERLGRKKLGRRGGHVQLQFPMPSDRCGGKGERKEQPKGKDSLHFAEWGTSAAEGMTDLKEKRGIDIQTVRK